MSPPRSRGPKGQNRERKDSNPVQLRVGGWRESKAASNQDGGLQKLREFLERRASMRGRQAKITSGTLDGDSLIITVPPQFRDRFLHLNGFDFAGAKISVEEIQAIPKSQPIPVMPPIFQDDNDIASRFLTAFFPLFDDNRELALQSFYDVGSSFSLSVNTNAKRVENPGLGNPKWDSYIKKSRNLKKITHPPARMSRSFKGQEAIHKQWSSWPKTRHPSFTEHSDKWLVECHPLPGLSSATGPTPPGGVQGLLVTTHGCFEEVDARNGQVTDRKSFDRTFVLGPGEGVGGIRVITDIIVLRAYGGKAAFRPTTKVPAATAASIITPTPPETTATPVSGRPPHPEIPDTSDFALPAPGKSEEHLLHEYYVLQLSFTTKMKLAIAEECLAGNGWDPARALANFQELVAAGKFPQEALLNV